MNMNSGGAEVEDVVRQTNETGVERVTTAEFTISNLEESFCAIKILDSTPHT
jgi:hypothetical protein